MRILTTSSNLVLFRDQMLETLSVHYKKITIIVSVIFAAIGTCFLLHYFYKSQSLKAKDDVKRSSTDVKSAQLSLATLTSVPRNLSSTVNTQVVPQVSFPSSIIEYNDVADNDDDVVNHEGVDDSDSVSGSDDENDGKWGELDDEKGNGEGFEVQASLDGVDLDAEFDNQPLDVSGPGTQLEKESKGARRVEPPRRYQIDGKFVSLRTYKCLQILKVALNKLEKKYGTARDDGDCFWDSFAQRLSVIERRAVTIEELRQAVSREVQRIDRGPPEANWVKKMMKGDTMDSYEEYRDRVAYSCSEALQEKFKPIWGTGARDGLILAQLYKVNLIIYEVGCLEEEEAGKKMYVGVVKIPKEQSYSRTVEIALYPGHFMPVQNKTER